MKMHWTSVGLTLVLLAAVVGVGRADYMTGFETSDDPGYIVGNTVVGVDGWEEKLSAANDITSDTLSKTGTQCLRVGYLDTASQAGTYHPLSLDTSGGKLVRVEGYIAQDATNPSKEGLFYVGSGTSTSSSNSSMQVWFDRSYNGNPTLLYKDGGTTMSAGTYTAGEYYHIVGLLDVESDTCDLTITGPGINLSVEDLAFRRTASAVEWINIQSYTPSGMAGGYMYADDVSITVVPEPTTMCLLGFGAAGVLLRRRKK
ncbi:MAG: PEP-CTERM sorting domain-containing protein [Phycisphaerae bacterium]|nr:PEP-CTERM sorting domain-containing protein [Phycisphaerae bacterium]